MQIPPAPLCQRGVRAGSPLRKRGVRGDLLRHAVQSCHEWHRSPMSETLSGSLGYERLCRASNTFRGTGVPARHPYGRASLPAGPAERRVIFLFVPHPGRGTREMRPLTGPPASQYATISLYQSALPVATSGNSVCRDELWTSNACARLPPMPDGEKRENVHGRVVRIAAEPKKAPRGGYLFRGLEIAEEAGNHRTFIMVPEFASPSLYEFPMLCWEGANISGYLLHLNNTLDDGTLIYGADPETDLILEPHRPVSVTDAVEAAECLKSADVRFRTGAGEPFWPAKGRLIHELFDHLLHTACDDESRFNEAYGNAVPALKEVLPGSSTSVNEEDLKREAKAHFRNLVTWLADNRERFPSAAVETDRISARWGLKGRADAVFRGSDRPLILELKSGRVPVDAHLHQLYAYSLLFSLAGETIPDGQVVYSANGRVDTLSRSEEGDLKAHILGGRNRVVALKHSYTSGEDLYERFDDPSSCSRQGKCFNRKHCYKLFGASTGSAPALVGREREYYDRWFRLVSIDVWEQENVFSQVLNPSTLERRIDEGVTIPLKELTIQTDSHAEPARGRLKDAPTVPQEQDSRGQAVSKAVFSSDFAFALGTLSDTDTASDVPPGEELIVHRGDPCSPEAFRARVTRSHEDRILLRFKVPLHISLERLEPQPNGDCRHRCHVRPWVSQVSSYDAGDPDVTPDSQTPRATNRNSGADFQRNSSGTTRERALGVEENIFDQTEMLSNQTGWFLDRLPFSRPREAARQCLFEFLTRARKPVVNVVVRGATEDPSVEVAFPGRADEVACTDGSSKDVTRLGNSESASGKKSADDSSDLDDLCFSEGLTAELNEDQEEAIRAALSSETCHLIHGPPGTGKTRVLARLIRLCLDRGERVLVACPTNVALDGLLLSVMDLGVREFLRIGHRSSVSRAFLDAVERIGSPPTLLNDLAAMDMSFREFRRRVKATQLVGATAYRCVTHSFFLKQRFDRVIVDEAGQLDEPSTLAPLLCADRFVLGGDHLQLPPIVQDRTGDSEREDDPGLEQSLFERLLGTMPDTAISRLNMQYRMNREVQDIPSRLFYDDALYPSPEAGPRRLCIEPGVSSDAEINEIVSPDPPVVFVDVQGPNGGRARPEEAEAAGAIIESLIAGGVSPSEVGIITPYRAQQALIRKRLSRGTGSASLSVDTVDRFQGGEREVIILSLSRSDGVTSFLADKKRLNVSLSRARSKLILLGHGPMLDGHPLFASILEGVKRVRLCPKC